MDINIDNEIQNKCMACINEYINKNEIPPTKLFLGIEEYRDLWIHTYYHWTREINKPHILTRYAGCDIEIKYGIVIECK